MKLRNHPRAKSRLCQIRDHYRDLEANEYAAKLFLSFNEAILHLPTHPELFPTFYLRAVPPPPRQFRRAIISDYAIIYVVVPERDAILIVDYWHNARDADVLQDDLDKLPL